MATKVIASGYNREQLYEEVAELCQCSFDEGYKVIIDKTRDEEGDVVYDISVESDDEKGLARLEKLWKVFDRRYDVRPYYMARFANEEKMTLDDIPDSLSRDEYKTNAATYEFVKEQGEGCFAIVYKVVPQMYYSVDEDGMIAAMQSEQKRREEIR